MAEFRVGSLDVRGFRFNIPPIHVQPQRTGVQIVVRDDGPRLSRHQRDVVVIPKNGKDLFATVFVDE